MGDILLISILFFAIAMLYSSAGFGGGSSYLATMSLFSIDFLDIRMIALLCNIAVVSSSVWLFYKNDLLKFKSIAPLIICSVPLAFLGGRFLVDQRSFYIILGVSLLLAAIAMVFDKRNHIIRLPKFSNAFIGGSIGFLSGMVGIGGGIFLSPVLHLSRWDTSKVIAASCAFFILVNSLAGLIGQISISGFTLNYRLFLPLVVSVIIGGQIGARLSILNTNQKLLRRITAFIILFVALRILIKYI